MTPSKVVERAPQGLCPKCRSLSVNCGFATSELNSYYAFHSRQAGMASRMTG